MKLSTLVVIGIGVVVLGVAVYFLGVGEREGARANPPTLEATEDTAQGTAPDMQVSMFANGCFWCVEADMEKLAGVKSVVSGYADGRNENPTYKNYDDFGHREVVQVTYDANVISYGNLVEHLLKHGDPTDGEGSFGDRGGEYAPAIYYEDETERQTALGVLQKVEASNVFGDDLEIDVLADTTFWSAEEYHQDYAEKNSLKYLYYRTASGRTAFIEKYWGDDATVFEFSE
jgi:peptide methionine sulfoxide reductase msrA/msrB